MKKLTQTLKNIKSEGAKALKSFKKRIDPVSKKTLGFVDKKPFFSFITLLIVLIALIALGNVIRSTPPQTNTKKSDPKKVEVYAIGKAPRLKVQATVEKTGVSKIVAQTGGIVQSVYKNAGDPISKGTSLFYISSNYQGANLSGVGRDIAEKNYTFIKDTYDTQKSVISTNREIAQKMEGQSQELLDIQGESVSGTQSLINLNQDILNALNAQIASLEAINVNGSSNSAILQLKLTQAGVQSALTQAQTQLKTVEYQSDDENEPSRLAVLQKDATVRALEIQEKTLDLNRDIAKLNLRIAQIQESFSYPATPFSGVVERVNVTVGQYVQPGAILATVSSSTQHVRLVVFTSEHIAKNVSRVEASTIYIDGKTIEVYPQYVSTEATEGNLFTIIYELAPEFSYTLANNETVEVALPIGTAQTNGYFPYIPLDSVFQTKNESFIFIVKESKGKKTAKSQKVTLGNIYGEYVEVEKGFENGMEVILDRNVIAGDSVETEME